MYHTYPVTHTCQYKHNASTSVPRLKPQLEYMRVAPQTEEAPLRDSCCLLPSAQTHHKHRTPGFCKVPSTSYFQSQLTNPALINDLILIFILKLCFSENQDMKKDFILF